jgi:hypothetical protein
MEGVSGSLRNSSSSFEACVTALANCAAGIRHSVLFFNFSPIFR